MEPSVKNVSPTDLAYIAGFFDGEGHIRIQRHSKRCRTMTLQCQISQVTEYPLVWIQERFGGTISGRLIKYAGGLRPIYSWQISSLGAEKFLRAIYPYLQVKQDEADVAILFRETFRPQHVKGGHKKMDESVIEFRQECSDKLKSLRIEKRENSKSVLAA